MTTNAYATGGGGADFERRVATAFVCHAITGTSCPPVDAPLSAIWLQAGHLGCQVEDLVLEVEGTVTRPRRRAYLSVKSAMSFTPSDENFREVIQRGWDDFHNPQIFSKENDLLGLIVAVDRARPIYPFVQLTELARACRDAADFDRRVNQADLLASSVRKLFGNVLAVLKQGETEVSSVSYFQFLRHFYVTAFDFDQDSSYDRARVIGLVRLASEGRDQATAETCWNTVFEQVSLAAGKAHQFGSNEFRGIAERQGLGGDLDQRGNAWLAAIRDHCRITREGISSKLRSNELHIDRTRERFILRRELSSHRVILVSGAAGSGKSALAIDVAEEVVGSGQVFCFSASEFIQPHLDVALQVAGLKEILLREWSSLLPLCPRVLLVDGVEHLLESSGPREAFKQLLREVQEDPRWSLLLTCRDYLSDEARVLEEPDLPWKVVEVPPLKADEVQQAVAESNFPASWLSLPVVAQALRNLKWLDFTLTAIQNADSVPTDLSAWSRLAEWRRHVWRKLLYQGMDVTRGRRCEELLISFGVSRSLKDQPWMQVEPAELDSAERLVALGLLRKLPPYADRFRIDHDLVEDWALLRWVERQFSDHCLNPLGFFSVIGNGLIIRRAFRQFFGELLEGPQQDQGIDFFIGVMEDTKVPKFWREEAVVALLGSKEASKVLGKTQALWLGQNAKEFLFLAHCLRIAYLRTPISKGEASRPAGPGWAALLEFVDARSPEFIQAHLRLIFDLLLDWKNAVQPDNRQPSGFLAASSLALKIWNIAIISQKRFEKLMGEENTHSRASQSRLASLMVSVAEGLGESFFQVADEISQNRSCDFQSPEWQQIRLAKDLITYLTVEASGWTVARAFPRLMVKICERHYGLEPAPIQSPYGNYSGASETCGLSAHQMDFLPSSALRGPFLTLLRYHAHLGRDFVLRLTNAAITRYVSTPRGNSYIAPPVEVTLTVGNKEVIQWADQGWWRCYRGASPYPELIESCLMALEKWLLEDVAIYQPEKLEETLLDLVTGSQNIGVTAVVASVANLYPLSCGKVALLLLCSPQVFFLDDHRCLNQSMGTALWRGFGMRGDIYEEERASADASIHYRESVEQTVFKAQFGPAQKEIWDVLDQYKVELEGLEQSDEVRSFRLRIHRMDLRNAVPKEREGEPDLVYLGARPPTADLQDFLNTAAEEYKVRANPISLHNWAVQIFDPLPGHVKEPERWCEMLLRAQELSIPVDNEEQQFLYGSVSELVAAACIVCGFWSEMDDGQKDWCENVVTQSILRDASLTQWKQGGLMAEMSEKVYLAQALGDLVGKPAATEAVASDRRRALAIALTHPNNKVVAAAAKAFGIIADAAINSLQFSGVELILRHARLRRMTDFKHRGPGVNDDLTWDQRCDSMHLTILVQTEKLREGFVNRTPANLAQLMLFYPRGFEEFRVFSAMLSILVRQTSVIARQFFSRALKWLQLQWYWDGPSFQRLYGRDRWRDHHVREPDPLTVREVSRMVAGYILNQPSETGAKFLMRYLFQNLWAARLGKEAGSLLKDLCLNLDVTGNTESFWAVWEEYRTFTKFIGSRIQNDSFWKEAGISKERGVESYIHLVSAVFLNEMYWQQDQEWKPLIGKEHLFSETFKQIGPFSFRHYLEFLSTIGSDALPNAWSSLSDVLGKIQKHSLAKNFLSKRVRSNLLRLIQKEVSSLRIPSEDKQKWKAIVHLLNYLVDEGIPEAHRLRDSLPRSVR